MNTLLEKLLQSLDIQLVIDQAKAVLWEEKKKRQEFYNWLEDKGRNLEVLGLILGK